MLRSACACSRSLGLACPRARRRARGGFTLLEILLASLLAALVLAAVYMLLNITLQQTQSSRDAVEAEDVSRGIFTKMGNDLSGTLAPLPPKSGGNSAGSGGASAAPASPTTTDPTVPSGGSPPADPSAPAGGSPGTSPPAPTAPTDASSDPVAGAADPNAPDAADNATAVAADYAFQGGVIGEEKKLVIYAGKVPEAFTRYGNPGEQFLSDQRQIIYWLGSNGGLYRRERPWVTADGVRNAVDNDEQALDSALIAEEIVDVLFEYFDGSSYVGTWDGTAPGPDGVTPLGPPRAIKVTLTMLIPVSRGEPITRQVSQVIVVRSAPGTYTPPLLEAPTDGGDNAVTDPAMGGDTGGMPGGNTGGTQGGNTGGNTPATGAPGGNTGGRPGGTAPTPGGMRPGGAGGAPRGNTGGARPGGGMGGGKR